jgi:hypothetical protein
LEAKGKSGVRMKHLFVLVIIGFIVTCDAFTFDKIYGDAKGEQSNSVKSTNDGGFVIVGSTGATGTDFESYYRNGFIIKTNPIGEIEWQTNYGDTLNEYFVDVSQTKDDGFVAVGAQDDGWIPGRFLMVKFDKFGKEKWSLDFADSTTKYIASSVIADSVSSEIIVAGSIYYPDKADDAWVMKLNKSGGIIWSRIIDRGSLAESAENLIIHPSGYLVCGRRENMVYNGPGIIPEYSAVSQGWIFLMDKDGNFLNDNSLSNDFYTCFNSLAITGDNKILVSGYHKKAIEMKDFRHVKELALAKFSASLGIISWQKYFSGMSYDYSKTGICTTSDNSFAVIASRNLFDQTKNDVWYMKFDENGNEIWQKTYGFFENDYSGNNIISLPDGFVFTGTINKANTNQNNYYVTGDICLVKTDGFGNIIYPPAITSFVNESNNISIGWDPVSNAGSYMVYGSDRADSNFTAIDTTTVNLWNSVAADSLKKKFYFIKASTNILAK